MMARSRNEITLDGLTSFGTPLIFRRTLGRWSSQTASTIKRYSVSTPTSVQRGA